MSRGWMAGALPAVLGAALALGSCDGGEGGGGTGPDLAAGMQAIGGMFATAATTALSGSLAGAPAPAAYLASPHGPESAAEAIFPDALEDFKRLEGPAQAIRAAALPGPLARAAGACGSGTATGACSDGGSVTAALTLGCTGPSGCCGRKNPCSQDSLHLQGQGSVTYNGCQETSRSGDVVTADGSLATTLVGDAIVKCWGSVDLGMTLTFNGDPTFTVNGKELCTGPTSVTATVDAGAIISVRIAGTICGQAVDVTYQEGCAVSCGDGRCCRMGSQCSTCVNGCIGIGYVDCCNGTFCPPGTRCSGDKCAYR